MEARRRDTRPSCVSGGVAPVVVVFVLDGGASPISLWSRRWLTQPMYPATAISMSSIFLLVIVVATDQRRIRRA